MRLLCFWRPQCSSFAVLRLPFSVIPWLSYGWPATFSAGGTGRRGEGTPVELCGDQSTAHPDKSPRGTQVRPKRASLSRAIPLILARRSRSFCLSVTLPLPLLSSTLFQAWLEWIIASTREIGCGYCWSLESLTEHTNIHHHQQGICFIHSGNLLVVNVNTLVCQLHWYLVGVTKHIGYTRMTHWPLISLVF